MRLFICCGHFNSIHSYICLIWTYLHWFQMFTFCCRLNFPSRFWKQNAVSTVLSLYKKQYNFKCKISDIFAIHQIKIRIDYQNWNQSYHHRATNLKKIERMSVIDWWHAYFQCKYCRRCYDKFSSRKGMQHPCAFCYTMNTAYLEVGVKNKDNWEREKIFFLYFFMKFLLVTKCICVFFSFQLPCKAS